MPAKKGHPNPRRAPMTGQEFRTLRQHMGLSVAALAKEIGCSAQSLYNIEMRAAKGQDKGISHALATLMVCLLDEGMRASLKHWRKKSEEILRKEAKTPCM